MPRLSLAPLLVVLLLAATLTLGVFDMGPLAMSDEPPVEVSGPVALVWSERVFTSKKEFVAFLRSRGESYRRWEARHPGMAPWDPRPRATTPRTQAAKAAREAVRPPKAAPASRPPTAAAGAPAAERAPAADSLEAGRLAELVDWAGRALLAVLAVGAALLGVRRLRRVRRLAGSRPQVRVPSLSLAVSVPRVRPPALPPLRPRAAVALERAAVVGAVTARVVARGSVVAAETTARAARRLRDEIDERELPMREIGFSVVGCLAVAAAGTFIALLLSGSY